MSACFYDFDANENIKKFICFSDEEGGAPFTFKDDEDLLQSVTDNQQNKTVVKELVESSFDCEDGMLTTIKSDTAVGFLGDLLDNNDKSIRVLKKMITLKTQNVTSVILIGGNRDFNKVRMGIECYMTSIEDDLLPWYKSDSEMYATPKAFIDSLKTIEFKYRVATKDQIDYLTFGDYDFGSLSRFKEMTKTLGFVPDNFYNEMKALFPDLKDSSPLVVDRFSCAMQMILSFEWDAGAIPTFFHDYIGLYTKYIKLCHVCALFKINDKYGFMSHAGYVHLTSPLGLDPTKITNTDALLSIMDKSENEKIILLSQLSTLKDATNQPYTQNLNLHSKIAKFVQLTAPAICDGKSCGYEFAPIITQSARTSQKDYLKEIKLKIKGGSWKHEDEKSQGSVKVSKGDEVISYNIYGHQPTCFFPTSNKTGETYHICLDVSKTDSDPNASYSNNFSFALFIIEKQISSIKFIGRTTLIKGNNLKNNYDIDKTTHLYYNVDIVDTFNNEKWKEIMKLEELTCGGVVLKDGKPNFADPNSFMRTVKTKIEGGKHKSRKNHKKSHKSKKQRGKRTRKANKKTHRCSSHGCRH